MGNAGLRPKVHAEVALHLLPHTWSYMPEHETKGLERGPEGLQPRPIAFEDAITGGYSKKNGTSGKV